MDNNERQKFIAMFDMIIIAIDQTNDRVNALVGDNLLIPDPPNITELFQKVESTVKELK